MDGKHITIQGIVGEFKQALSLLTTVISRPPDQRAVNDAGMKAISHEFGMPKIAIDEVGVALHILAE